jgi:predicted MFS family arabinose efflux permease
VIQFLGWRTLFWGQLGLLVVASAVVALLLPTWRERRRVLEGRSAASPWQGMDWVGSWTLAGAVTSAMLVLSIGPIVGWDSVGVMVAGAAAIVLGAVFVWREATFATPLVPTTYWRRRNFMFPLGTKGFSSFAYFGGFFLFPLLMEQVYGYSVSQVGFISVARPLLFAVSAPIAGYMTVRTGERTATLFGTGALFVSLVLFATLGTSSGLFVVVVALSLSGLGMGVSLPATSSTMSNELAESEYGVMSAAQLLAAQVGEVAGIQVVLTIQESIARRSGLANVHHSPALLHSFSVAFWVGAVVAALSVGCALFIRPLARHGEARSVAAATR